MQKNDLLKMSRRVKIPLVIVTPIQIVLRSIFARFIVAENEKKIIQISSRFAFKYSSHYLLNGQVLSLSENALQNNTE